MKQCAQHAALNETLNLRMRTLRLWLIPSVRCAMAYVLLCTHAAAQQPTEPIDISPIDGEVYYVVNQLSGMQLDLDDQSKAAGAELVEDARSFTSLSQRWAFTRMPSGTWSISNIENGLCLDRSVTSTPTLTLQNPCLSTSTTQQWSLNATSNGYMTLKNAGTGLVLDVLNGANTAGSAISQTAVATKPTQSQQWLLRPAFFRGVDTALLEKQEAQRVAGKYPWWQDAGKAEDVLQLLKSHGVNMVRIRPTSEPPYNTFTSTTCTGNGCYTETDAADLNLAKRAKQLGMSVELTLLFDGGSSTAIPGAWAGYTLAQAETAVYSYVKTEIEAYRNAGVMPDMVTIGNEVDTGFLGSIGSPTGSNFAPFAALEKEGMQAIEDASSETTTGPALPVPIRCIHITPNWSLTSFFGYVQSNAIPYDAMCQSYYPIYHGPLTPAQATASNPNDKPVEETALTAAANMFGKPIFIIETGEHYENGFDANDPWYPATVDGQRQFLIDLNAAVKALPDNLGMGIEYWDPEGVNIPKAGGGFTSGDGLTNAIYTWNGLTLFDNADTSGETNTIAANYSAVLAGVDALGGKLDSTLAYKLVNVGNGEVLQTASTTSSDGIALAAGTNTGGANLPQQWKIVSDGNGYFQIANLNVATGGTVDVLDADGASAANSLVCANTSVAGKVTQEWNIVTAGGGTYAIVNRSSGLVLGASGTSTVAIEQQAPAATTLDWITPVNALQQWQIVPVHITETGAPAALGFATNTPTSLIYGTPVGTLHVNVVSETGVAVTTPAVTVMLTVQGPDGYLYKTGATSSNGIATFGLTGLIPKPIGTYTISASANGLIGTTATLTVTKAVLKIAAANSTRAYGAVNPTFAYTVTGFVDGDTRSVLAGAPVLSTSAAATSAPGNYPIAIAAGTLSAVNYTFTFGAGVLTVTPATTATALSTSATSVYPGKSIVLTATVTDAGEPVTAGIVTFFDGQTVLGTGTLSTAGMAILTTASLVAGANELTADYGGNADFYVSKSSTIAIAQPDFSIAASSNSVTLSPASTVSLGLTLTPVAGYTGAITLGCSSTLTGVTCAFSPAAYSASGSNGLLKGTVTIAASSIASGSGSLTITAAGAAGPVTQTVKLALSIH